MNGRDQTQTIVEVVVRLQDHLNSHTVDDNKEPDLGTNGTFSGVERVVEFPDASY